MWPCLFCSTVRNNPPGNFRHPGVRHTDTIIKPSYHHIIISSYHHITISCHHIITSSHHHISVSSYHHIIISSSSKKNCKSVLVQKSTKKSKIVFEPLHQGTERLDLLRKWGHFSWRICCLRLKIRGSSKTSNF